MSCHESLMARRRKKSRAAAKLKKDDQSPMLVDKSLPALPPNAILQSAFSPDRETPDSLDTDTPTELSPRPRQGYAQNDSSSRSSSRRPREQSPERNSSDTQTRDGLTLPTTTYRNNRHSAISQASDINGGDGESFFIPLALDPTPAPSMTPRSTSESWADPGKKTKENKPPEKDYFGAKSIGRQQTETQKQRESSTPHIAFQEKGRQPSAEETAQIRDSLRKAAAGGKSSSAKASPAIGSDDIRVQHAAQSPKPSNGNNKGQSGSEKFRLGDVPKGKKSGTSRTNSQSEISDNNNSRSGSGGLSAPPRKEGPSSIPRTDSPKQMLNAEKSTPRSSQDSRIREELESRKSIESSNSPPQISRMDSGGTARSIPRKEIASGAVKNTMSSISSSSGADTSPSSASSSDTPGLTPTINGKSISGPLSLQSPSASFANGGLLFLRSLTYFGVYEPLSRCYFFLWMVFARPPSRPRWVGSGLRAVS